MNLLIPLFASILPFVLWPIELALPYPHIIEELAKAALVFVVIKEGRVETPVSEQGSVRGKEGESSEILGPGESETEFFSGKFKILFLQVIFMAVMFSFSETVLYLTNIYNLGTFSTLLTRLFATTILHITTMLIIFVPTVKNVKLLPIALVPAVLIHYCYNQFFR